MVQPHTTRIVVWDVPSAVTVGGRFRLKVGLKCSHGCQLERRGFMICDSAGKHLAAGTVGGETWRGATAIFFGEVEVDAPLIEGHQEWRIRAPVWIADIEGTAGAIAHEEGSISFEVRSVLPPECLVRVKVVDAPANARLVGASVVMSPYRTVTDDRGIAEMSVVKGQYKVQVSQANHFASNRLIHVTEDTDICVELDTEPEENPDDRYVW